MQNAGLLAEHGADGTTDGGGDLGLGERRIVRALPGLQPATLLSALRAWSSRRDALPAPLAQLVGDGAPVDDRHVTLHYLARNAIHHGLRALGLGDGAPLLMPAWHHGVEVEAARSAGARPVFYRVDRAFRADLDHARRLAIDEGARGLYLTHFLGFAQPVDEAAALCDELGMRLVEDCALALLSRDPAGRTLGGRGDLSVYCLYKTLPVPHGGVASCVAPLCVDGRTPRLLDTARHLAGSLHAHASQAGPAALAALFEAGRRLAGGGRGPLAARARTGTRHLEGALLDLRASRLLPLLLRGLDGAAVVEARRRNFLHLAASLGHAGAPVRALEPGTCPLFYPLAVPDKRRALSALARRGIEGVDFWSDGDPACPGEAFADVQWLRRHLLEVPIHQDLDDEALGCVARAVKDVLRDG